MPYIQRKKERQRENPPSAGSQWPGGMFVKTFSGECSFIILVNSKEQICMKQVLCLTKGETDKSSSKVSYFFKQNQKFEDTGLKQQA